MAKFMRRMKIQADYGGRCYECGDPFSGGDDVVLADTAEGWKPCCDIGCALNAAPDGATVDNR